MISNNVYVSVIYYLIFGAVMAPVYHAVEYRWPSETMWISYFIGCGIIGSYQKVVRLLERQNVLLEKVLSLLADENEEYRLPIGR